MGLLAAGLLLVSLSVLLVGAASQHTVVTANQRLADYWRTTYDILVRPAGSRSPIEEKYGLVEANHLSGIWGGITFEQYETIKSIPGVAVAAPIAMLGYGPALGTLQLTTPSERGVYAVEVTGMVDDGIRVFTPPTFPQRTYYYYTQAPPTRSPGNLPRNAGDLIVDWPFLASKKLLVT